MLFSTIITTYNRKNYVVRAIESALSQTFRDSEVIVVDDGSVDGTGELLKEYFKDNIVYFYQDNRERGAARNSAIKIAKGNYIAFLDSDDEWLPNHLEVIHNELISKKDIHFFYTLARCINEEGQKLGLHQRYGTPSGYILTKILKGNFVTFSTACVKKEIFNKVGLFSEDREMSGSEDWHMWVRVACYFPFYNIPELTVHYRVHSKSSMSDINITQYCKMIAIESLFSDGSLSEKIIPFKNMTYGYGSVFIGVAYYVTGRMKEAREYFFQAAWWYPKIILTTRFVYFFLRTLLGKSMSQSLRTLKNRFYFSL